MGQEPKIDCVTQLKWTNGLPIPNPVQYVAPNGTVYQTECNADGTVTVEVTPPKGKGKSYTQKTTSKCNYAEEWTDHYGDSCPEKDYTWDELFKPKKEPDKKTKSKSLIDYNDDDDFNDDVNDDVFEFFLEPLPDTYCVGCRPPIGEIEDEAPSDLNQGKGLPPEMGGTSRAPSATVQQWVRRLLEMENGKKETHIVPSRDPAPIDPAEPDSPRPHGPLPPPPPHPADPRRIRPTDPDEFTSGVVGQTVMTLAKKTFPEIFAGEQVMPSSAGPRPFDPIYDEKRRGTMIPPKDWNPYGPRTRINSMLLPDDIQGARSKR